MLRRYAMWVGFLFVAASWLGNSASAAALLNWDPTATNSSAGGGAGTWNTASWYNSTTNSDVSWANGDDAAFGGATAGVVTIASSVSANDLIFNTAGYTVTGSSLTLTGGTVGSYASATISSFLAGTAGLTKIGAGTLTINGSKANGYTGGTTINRGVLQLSYTNNMATPTNLIDPGDLLTMGGGTLSILGATAGATSQTFSGLAITGGANSIALNANGGGGTTLALNNITQTAGSGGTLKFSLPAGASVTTTTLDQPGGIIGGWAIIDNGNSSYSWAHSGTNSGTFAISAGTTNNSNGTPATTDNWAPNGIVNMTTSLTVNSLIETADIHLAGNTLTVLSGGIILQSNNFWMQDSTGTLTSGLASGELFVHCPNAGLTDTEIRVAVTDNATTSVSLIKDGPGNLIMQSQNAASNSYSGNTIVNGGTLTLENGFGATGELGGTPNIIINAGAALQLNAGDVIGYTGGKEALTINSGGTVSNITAAARVTIQNLLTMTGGILTGSGTGDGNGQYSFNNGAAGILATSDSAGNPSVISASISPQNTNLLFTVNRGPANPASDLNVTGNIIQGFGTGNGIVTAGNGLMTLSGNNTYTGGTTISSGTLVVGGAGVLGNGAYAGAITTNSLLVMKTTSAQVFSGLISGTGSLTDSGAGILALTTATNSYGGGTTLIGGQIEMGNGANENAAALGTGPVTISSGGTLHMMPGSTATIYNIANSFALNGATVIGEGGVQHLGAGGATISIGAAGAAVEATLSGQDVYIDGTLTGSGALALAHGPTAGSAAVVHITNSANSYNGTVSVSGAGNGVSLDLDNNTALQFATVNLNPGTAGLMLLTETGVSTIAGLTGTGGTVEAAAVSGVYTLNINSVGNSTYGGILVNSTGTLGLGLSGNGRLTLTSNGNNYAGGTTIGGGTLQVGNGGVTGSIGSGGVLDNSTLLFNLSNTGGVTFNNAISGSGNIVQAGSGWVVLSGANNYGGGTVISAGTLQLGNSSALGSTSGSLAVNNGLLDLNGNNSTQGAVTIVSGSIVNSGAAAGLTGTAFNLQNGVIGPNLTLVGSSFSAQNSLIGGSLSGNSATLSTVGVVTLTGSSNFGGGTTINGGTLNINNDYNLGSSTSGLTLTGGSSTLQQASSASVSLGGGRSISISSGTAVIDTQGNAMSIAGAISGSGALIKINSGALTLGGSDTYTGATKVNVGGLYINGSLPSSAISVAAGAVIGGSGTIGLTTTIASGGTVDVSRNSATSTLDLASTLSFSGAGAIDFGALNQYTPGSPLAAVTAGTLSVSQRNGVSLVFPGGLNVSNGTYDLISYKTLNGAAGFQGISLPAGQPTGLGGRQTRTLVNNTALDEIQLTVSGDFPIWTGANGSGGVGQWVGQNNYVLYYAGTATDFQASDTIQFNDVAATLSSGTTAVKSTTVNIAAANVFPASVTFNNNALSYTITGAFGMAGNAVLVMNGTGTVTIANSNSYSGATTLNAGQLNINNASALGTSPLTIAGAGVTLDNTSGTAITLSTNNNQFWNSDFTFIGSNNLNMGSGSVALGSSRVVTVNGGNLSVGGPISGAGASLTLAGGGQLTLGGANTYNSGTLISAGTLTAAGNSALGTGPVMLNPSSGTAVLAFTSAAPAIASLASSGVGSSLVVLGNVAGASPTSLTVGGGNTSSTFSGTITDGSAANAAAIGSLFKSGNGILVLPGATTYTGSTSISGGTLEIGNGTVGEQFISPTVNNGGTLVFSHADSVTYAGSVGGSGALVNQGTGLLMLTGGSNTFTGGTTIGGGTLQIGDGLTTNGSILASGNVLNNGTMGFAYPMASTFSGVISGSGGVDKSGTGGLTLDALQSYTGGTTVDGGTLSLNNNNGSNGNGTGSILGVLTINPGAEVNIIAHDVFGYSNSATGLLTLNINRGVLNQSFSGNETVTGVTENLTGGTMSSTAGGYFDMFSNGFGNTNLNTLPSTATSVISAAIRLRETPNPIFTVSSGSTATGIDLLVSGQINQIAAGDGFTKAGPGVMQLSNSNNTYSGVALVSAGTLQSASNGALGPGTAGLSVSSGAVVDLYGSSPTVGGLNGGGTIDNSQGGAPVFTVGGGGAGGTFSGTIRNATGSMSLVKIGAGSQYLSGTNTYSGGTTLSGGTLNFSPGAIPLGTNRINFNGGTLQWATGNTQDVSSSIAPIANGISAGIDPNGNNITFGSSLSGSGGLALFGSGTLSLAVANSFSGATTINGGTLNLAHPLALQNSTVAPNGGGTASFAAGITTPIFGGLSGNGNINLATATSQPVALNVGNNGQNTTFSGTLTGGGELVKVGGGLTVLANSQSYAGATIVSSGTVQLAVPNIGIKFETGQGGTPHPVTGTAGAIPMGNWNNLPGQTQTTPQPLNNNWNTPTTATVTWTGAADNYSVSTADMADQNAQLLNSYLDDSANTTPVVTVNGVPFSNYNVYVYFGSDGNGRTGSVSIAGTTYDYTTAANSTFLPYPLQLTTDTSGIYPAANYAIFSGLSGSSFTVTNTHGSNNSGIAAVEVVSTVNTLPAASPLVIASNATLDLGGANQQVGSLSNAAPGLGGTVTNSGLSAAILSLGTTGSATFSGLIADGTSPVGLTMNGSGIQVLAGTSTYTGGTTVASGVLLAQNTGALAQYLTSGNAISVAVSAGATFAVQAGTLSGEFGLSDVDVVRTTANFAAGANFGIQVTSPESFVYNSSIGDSFNGPLGIVKLGNGLLTLNGPNSYSNGTTVSGGTLQMGANNATALGSPGSLTVNRGILDMNGNSLTVTTLNGGTAGTITSNLAVSASLTVTTGGAFAGTIEDEPALASGSAPLTLMVSGGTLVLSGTNGYSGGTFVDAGMLVDAGNSSIPNGSSLTVSANATFSFDSTQASAGPVVGSNTASARGIAAVPEPGTIALLVAAIGSAAGYRRFRRRTNVKI